MEGPISTFRTLQGRASKTYATVILPASTPTASEHSSSTSTSPTQTATQHSKSSVSTGTFVGVVIALVVIIIVLLSAVAALYYRLRKLRQQPIRPSPRSGTSSNPPGRTGSALNTRHVDIPMTSPPRPYGAPPGRGTPTPKPPSRSEMGRRDTGIILPYSNRTHTPTPSRATMVSPTTPTRTRVPGSARIAPPITVSSASPPKQTGMGYDNIPQHLNAAFLQGHPTGKDVRDQLNYVQMLSDTTDMSTDTQDGRRPLMNEMSNERYLKAAAQNKNLALLGSDASENPGDDPISQIYGGTYPPPGRRVQGANTWHKNGSGVTIPKQLHAKSRAEADRQDVLMRPRPVQRN